MGETTEARKMAWKKKKKKKKKKWHDKRKITSRGEFRVEWGSTRELVSSVDGKNNYSLSPSSLPCELIFRFRSLTPQGPLHDPYESPIFLFFFFFGWLVRPRAVSLSPAGRKEEGSLRPTGVLPRGIVRGRLIAVRSHPTPPSHPDFAICGDVYALPGKKLWTSLSSVWNDIDPSHEREKEKERKSKGESDIIFARKEKFVEESYFVVR